MEEWGWEDRKVLCVWVSKALINSCLAAKVGKG